MTTINVLFEDIGVFRCYSDSVENKTNTLLGGIWKEVPDSEWSLEYTTNKKYPVLNIVTQAITWIPRPSKVI